MRQLSPAMLDAISGSVTDARLVCYAWYDGHLAEQAPLPISTWSIAWDGSDTNMVQGKANFTVADPTGRLAPWGFDEPLSSAGSKIQASFHVGDESVDLAWLTVATNAPTEQWRVVGPALQWVSGGASIPVEADDLTLLVSDSPFISSEAPAAGATVIGEVRRLLTGICPVTVAAGVVDGPVPSTVVYANNRLGVVFDLVKSINCRYRMTGAGQLEIYSLARTAPVWTLQGGNGGALVTLNRKQARADLINGVQSTGSDVSQEVKQLAKLDYGPLRWDGPFGRKIDTHNAIATDAPGVLADATTILTNSTQIRTLPLYITCTPNPAVQIGDWVRVAQPTISGNPFPLDGMVSAVTLSGSAAGVDSMQLTVQVSAGDAQTVGMYIRKAPTWV